VPKPLVPLLAPVPPVANVPAVPLPDAPPDDAPPDDAPPDPTLPPDPVSTSSHWKPKSHSSSEAQAAAHTR
jgi:hypothetical protein